MISKHIPSQARKGFTLTEIAIVLGIMGLILGAIWTAASSVYTNQRTAHAQTAILQIAQGIRSLYAASANTGYAQELITNQMNNAGVIPADLKGGTSGPFPNGTTGIISTGDGLGFVVAMTSVPQQNCINLLMGLAGDTKDPGLYKAVAVADGAIAAEDADALAGTPLGSTVITMANAINAAPVGQVGGCGVGALTKVRFGFTVR